MVRHVSFRRQRVPMVDGVTLEGRTRPLADLPSAVSMRLRYVGWSRSLDGVASRRFPDDARRISPTLADGADR